MKRTMLWLLAVGFAAGLAGPLWAQAPPAVTLGVLNPVTPGTNVAVVVQGDPVQVQYTVNPLTDVILSPSDLIQLRRMDNEGLVSEQARGDSLSGTVSLSTTPSNAVGDLKAVYATTGGAVLAAAPQTVRVVSSGPGGPTSVVVPSRAAPTIQAGIDMVADGGTVNIGPGTYRERLLITGKRVNLVGSGSSGLRRTLIAGTVPRTVVPYQQAQGLISFGPAGGGVISNLILQGGDAGVVGLEDVGGTPAPVQIKNAVIRLTGRGVLGSFGKLAMEQVAIVGTRWNAVAITHCAALDLFNGIVGDTGGVGILVYNLDDPSGLITITNQTVGFFMEAGIAIVGGAKPVSINNCFVGIGLKVGILLSYAGQVEVANTQISTIVLGSGPVYYDWADGLTSAGSHYVWIHGCLVHDCQRAGLLFDMGNSGVIQTTQSVQNRFALAVLGDPKPDYSDPLNVFSGTEEDILTDGDLPVPSAPPLP